jgi:guanosine-3',5'-bis(diphosphate) 3'-pyrophosphohydrolase
MIKVSKPEARVIQLQKDLARLEMWDALRALNWMIQTMNANNGYKRKDGSHYYYHLVDATQDLINHGERDQVTITACILHDAVEDIPELTIEDVREEFGDEVAEVVDLVTKKEGIDYKDAEGKNITVYLQAILRSLRACKVKTSDRKHNFSTLDSTSAKHEARQVDETEKYFIPFFKEARKRYPEHSAYFHSAKTTIVPHLKRIKKAIVTENKLKAEIEDLKMKLEQERKRNNALENKIKKGAVV